MIDKIKEFLQTVIPNKNNHVWETEYSKLWKIGGNATMIQKTMKQLTEAKEKKQRKIEGLKEKYNYSIDCCLLKPTHVFRMRTKKLDRKYLNYSIWAFLRNRRQNRKLKITIDKILNIFEWIKLFLKRDKTMHRKTCMINKILQKKKKQSKYNHNPKKWTKIKWN